MWIETIDETKKELTIAIPLTNAIWKMVCDHMRTAWISDWHHLRYPSWKMW